MGEALTRIREDLSELSRSLGQTPSLPDQVSLALHRLIMSGRLGPGDRIVERKLARELKVGQPTVREALSALEQEGLITRRRKSGCVVTVISRKEYDQIFRIRLSLETLAAELAVENRANWKPDELLAAVGSLKSMARAHDIEGFYHTDLEFHKTMWRLSGNPYIEKMLTQVTVPLFAFVMIRIVAHSGFDLESAAQSHEQIANAICSGDKERARETVWRALEGFWKMGLELLPPSGHDTKEANS